MALLMEQYDPNVAANGIQTNKPVIFGSTVTFNGPIAIAAAQTITSASANAFVVGPNGATNPAFNVDASTASSATGLNVKSAAAAAGLAVSVISSGTNENLTIDAKGSGVITLGSVSTGGVTIAGGTLKGPSAASFNIQAQTGQALVIQTNGANTMASFNAGEGSGVASYIGSGATNSFTAYQGTGATTAGFRVTSTAVQVLPSATATAGGANALQIGTSNVIGIYFGSGAPTVTAPQGSLYLRTDGSSTSTRMYVNTTGSTTWTAVTTAA